MTNIDEVVAAAKAEMEAWHEERIRQIRADGDARMQGILANARRNMEKGLANALVGYETALRDIQKQREEYQKRDPEIAERMAKMMLRFEESAKKDYEVQVEIIKDMYKRGLGIE